MKRICKECNEEKDIEKFVKGSGLLYRYLCKSCRQKSRRTGKPNTGRFKIGEKSKGVTFKKGHIPWYKQKGLSAPNKGKVNKENENRFTSFKYKEWERQVKERDNHQCAKCGSNDRIAAHHIKRWKEFPGLRFEVSNGLTLCFSCHGKEEGFKKNNVPWNKAKNNT